MFITIGFPFTLFYCDIIANKLFGTEIERNDIKTNSVGQLNRRNSWVDNLVILAREIPDFSFKSTKNLKNRESIIEIS